MSSLNKSISRARQLWPIRRHTSQDIKQAKHNSKYIYKLVWLLNVLMIALPYMVNRMQLRTLSMPNCRVCRFPWKISINLGNEDGWAWMLLSSSSSSDWWIIRRQIIPFERWLVCVLYRMFTTLPLSNQSVTILSPHLAGCALLTTVRKSFANLHISAYVISSWLNICLNGHGHARTLLMNISILGHTYEAMSMACSNHKYTMSRSYCRRQPQAIDRPPKH